MEWGNLARSLAESSQRETELARQRLPPDAVEGREGPDAVGGVPVARRPGLHGGDHEVLRRVLGRDEFEGLRPVAGPFQEFDPQGVGRELGLALEEDPVAQGAREDGRGGELRPELLLAAGGHDEKAGAGRDAAGQGVVGRGVAGVKRDQDVDPFKGGVRDGPGRECQALAETLPGGGPVAQFHEVRARRRLRALGPAARAGR